MLPSGSITELSALMSTALGTKCYFQRSVTSNSWIMTLGTPIPYYAQSDVEQAVDLSWEKNR